MKKFITILVLLFVISSGSLFSAKDSPLHPTKISKALHFDLSPNLRDMQIIPPTTESAEAKESPDKSGDKSNIRKSIPFNLSEDPVLQKQDGTYRSMAVAPIQNFDGMPNILGYYPPDTQGDVSGEYYIQVVNINFAIFSKTGTMVFGPANLNTIWSGIGAPFEGTGFGDPVVLFDQAADRWMITQFGLNFGADHYAELVAISQTSDPTGAWYRYVFDYGNIMPDYPKFGIWPDGYYMATNQFIDANGWGGAGATAFERTKMISGDPAAQMIYFDLGAASDPGGMLPSDWDGVTPPVAAEPNHFTYFNSWSGPDDYLRIWDFHVDWITPANSTFGLAVSLTTAPFNPEICSDDPSGRGQCIDQPGTAVRLESLSDRLMYRLQYRNFGTYQSMVTNHSVNIGSNVAGIRWYELRNTGTGWNIYQQGTWAPADGVHRWMGSIAMNSVGDIALGYSVSDATSIYPSIRYTGRKPGDPLGTMTISEQTIKDGSGYQWGTAARWGDYSMMSVDPSDDVTFWYTTEYIETTGSVSWKTRITSFNISNAPLANSAPATAVAPTTATLNGTVNPNSLATNYHFEYGTTSSYGLTTPTLTAGNGTSAVPFSADITTLTTGSTYHFRLVATNAEGTSNSSELTFIPGGATLTTATPSAITAFTATSGGDITDDGGFAITERGVCWGLGQDPTIASNHTSDGSGTGAFVSDITGLSPGTHYHVRAYATSSVGTFYGDDLNFTSATGIAILTTTPPSSITKISALSGGDITSDGGYAVTERGVCWSQAMDPTTTDDHTLDGAGTGAFVSSITGLSTATTYHVRSYATNIVGTFYGDDLTFYTLCDPSTLPLDEEFSTNKIPMCWTQVDHEGNGQIWQFGTFNSPYTPPYIAPALTGNYAYLDSDAFGTGNTQNADLITPTLDLSDYATVSLSFNYFFIDYLGENASISYSIDDGANWVTLAAFPNSANNPESFLQIIPAVAGQPQVKFMWNYTGTYGYWYAIDDVQINGIPLYSWTGAISTLWSDPANWYSNLVPGSTNNVYIPDVANDPIVNELQDAPAVCNNLTIDPLAMLTITDGKALTVNGTLTNNAGAGGIVIQSNASGTGSLINGTTGVEGTMQRFIPLRTDALHGWHLLSSPVAVQPIQTEFVPNPPNSGTQAFFSWDEPSALWINTKDGSGNWAGGFESDFIVGKGYLVNYASDVTRNFTGEMNVSDVTISGLPKSASIYTGWNLIGNPFTSALTWHTGWSLANIAAVAKIWNGSGASYSDINPGDIIPATQGVMVQVTSATGSLTIPASARTHSSQAWFKSSGDPLIILKANDLAGQTFQESVIRFKPESSIGFDADFDSYFLEGYAPQFYSVEGGENLSTNVLPGMDWQTIIPFSFIKTEGSDYTIEAEKLENISQPVYLVDLKLNNTQNLKENPVYSFTSLSTDDPARFLVAFRPLGIEAQQGSGNIIYIYNGTLYITNPGESTLEVYNTLGQEMVGAQTHGELLYSIKLNAATGYYVVRLTSDQKVRTEKVFVK